MRRAVLWSVLIALVLSPLQSTASAMTRLRPASTRLAARAAQDAMAAFGAADGFERVTGRTDWDTAYHLHAGDYTAIIARDGMTVAIGNQPLEGGTPAAGQPALRVRFADAAPVSTLAEAQSGDQKITSVTQQGLYPGVDLVYSLAGDNLRVGFTLAPRADAKAIKFVVEGADSTRMDSEGNLVATVGSRSVTFARPSATQDVDGATATVAASFRARKGENAFRVHVGAYDAESPLAVSTGMTLGSGSASEKTDAVVSCSNNLFTGGSTSSPFSTFNTNGSASVVSGNIQLTPNLGGREGSAWNDHKLDLTKCFDLRFYVNLGNDGSNTGGEGIVFGLLSTVGRTTQPTLVGSGNGGIGFGGITNSLGIEIDTAQTALSSAPDDPSNATANAGTHLAMNQGGAVVNGSGQANRLLHNVTTSPASPLGFDRNIKDNLTHMLRVQWLPSSNTTGTLTATVEQRDAAGAVVSTKAISWTGDLLTLIGGSTTTKDAWFGFTSATGPSATTINSVRAFAAPAITSINPSSGLQGAAVASMTITGTDFTPDAIVYIDGIALTTTYVNSTTLKVSIPGNLVATVGNHPITVKDSITNQTSNSVNYTVTGNASAPTLTNLNPSSIPAGSGNTVVTLTGTNFAAGATVNFNGTVLTPTSITGTTITVTVPSTLLATAGSYPVYVVSGGLSTNTLNETVAAPVAPTVTAVNPSTVGTSASPTNVTLTGTNFTASTTVSINGTTISASNVAFVNSTTLTVTIPAANLASPGTLNLGAANGASASATTVPLTVINAPTVTAVNPSTVGTSASSTNVTLTGTNFTASTVATVNGTAVTTVFVNSTTLTVTVPAANLASPGTLNLGASTSGVNSPSTVPLTVINAPTVTSVNPSTVGTSASPKNVTLTGTNFTASTVATVNGTPVTTVFVNSTTLTVTIPAANLGSAGTLNLGASTSGVNSPSTVPVTVVNTPTVTSVMPSTVATTSGTTTDVMLMGTNFTASTVVTLNGSALPAGNVAFVSATKLTVTIPAANLASPGTLNLGASNSGIASPTTVPLTVGNAPTVTSVNPSVVATTSGTTTNVTLTGTNFTSNTVATVNGTQVTTAFVNSTTLTVTIPAANLASPGTLNLGATDTGTGLTAPSTVPLNVVNTPTVTSVNPSTVATSASPTNVTLTGTNFTAGTTVSINGTTLPAGNVAFVNSTTLTVTLPATNLGSPTTLNLGAANSGIASPTTVPVTVVNTPTVTSVMPTTVATTSGTTTDVMLIGTNFTASTTVTVNGTTLPAGNVVFVNSGKLTVTIPAANLGSPGTLNLGASNSGINSPSTVPLTVANAPTLTNLNPATVVQGAAGSTQSVTLTGTNFVSGASVYFNGSPLATTFNSSTSLTATFPKGTAGGFSVYVQNPSGLQTGSLTFTVQADSDGDGVPNSTDNCPTIANPGQEDWNMNQVGDACDTPVLTSLSPTNANQGSGPVTVTLTGNGFVPGAVICVDGQMVTTTFVNSTTLTFSMPTTTAGGYSIVAKNPSGLQTQPLTFTVNAASGPTISGTPASVCSYTAGYTATTTAGGPYLWTIMNGTITSGATSQTVTYTAGASGTLKLSLTAGNVTATDVNIPISTDCFDSEFGTPEAYSTQPGTGMTVPNGWIIDTPQTTNWGPDLTNGLYVGMSANVYGWGSISHTVDYSDTQFLVKMARFGNTCPTCANSLWVRGNPTPLPAYSYRWASGYQFSISQAGKFSIWYSNGAGPIALQAWTTSAAINTGSGASNILRVIANGPTLRFLINNTEVYNQTLTTNLLTTGKVGVAITRSTGAGLSDTLSIDYAKLAPVGTVLNKGGNYTPLSKKQKRINRTAQRVYDANPSAQSPDQSPE